MDMYLRVAPELFLKKMIVGQFGKVFEIGKNFRNEGIDLTHNPEFTSCEFYWAYADVYDLMSLTEELVSSLVKELTGSYKTTFTTQHGETFEVNWEAPWRRVEMIPELERVTGEKFPPYDQLHTEETNQFLQRLCKKMNVECPPPLTNARMIDKLTGEFIESTCINPTFILNHPQMMSPLAKYHRDQKGLCERFEVFVCKKEIANAYTELNNPFDQRLRFEEQARQKAQGDDEAYVKPTKSFHVGCNSNISAVSSSTRASSTPWSTVCLRRVVGAWVSTVWPCSSPTTTRSAKSLLSPSCVRRRRRPRRNSRLKSRTFSPSLRRVSVSDELLGGYGMQMLMAVPQPTNKPWNGPEARREVVIEVSC